jgi:prepilin-type processing-associated H-X9-DG protein
MLHSWQSHSLDGLNYSSQGIDKTKPWNDPVNQKYFKCILPVFINSGFRTAKLEDSEGYGLSHYAANSHVLAANKSMKLTDIKDGTGNTLLVGEINAKFKPWGHPVNWRDPTAGINRSPQGFGGVPHRGGANFVMADGTVRLLSEKISPEVLRALATPNGGEDVREEGWLKR